jgi:alkylation response protein AidB-like acyl-CoA dehydrogenase
VQFENVFVPEDCLLAGPIENVMSSGIGGRTGGLQTSALALGLTRAALDYIAAQAEQRAELHESLTSLEKNWTRLLEQMIELAESNDPCSIAASANTLETRSFDNESLRRDANDLVLRSTHAALATAKGAGFVASHPVARWCREALFFLVWSCPQKVVTANLCQFAGIGV